jgi:hypothetical protein
MKRSSEAARDWDNALGLLGNAASDAIRLRRAYVLVQAGEAAKGLPEVEKLITSPSLPGDLLYDAACAFALAAGVKDQSAVAERHAAKALHLLQRAQTTGFFRPPQQLAWLKQDPDLDALRARADFREWLAQLERKTGP